MLVIAKVWGMSKWGDVSLRTQNVGYKMNKCQGCNVQYGDFTIPRQCSW